jgi:hypothetical protein
MRLKEATVEGRVVRVGDVVGVKADFETYGEIIEIKMNDWGRTVLQLWNPDGEFYGNLQVMDGVPEDKCWIL